MTETDSPPSPWIIDTTEELFERDVIERSKDVPVVVDFWASWCQPCKLLGPILERLAVEQDGRFVLVKAETEKLPRAATSFGVQSIPAVYGLRDGEIVDFFVGMVPEESLRQWIERLMPSESETLVAEARTLEVSEPAEAEAKYRRAIELAPHDPGAKTELARFLLEADRIEESGRLVDELNQRGFLEPEAEKIKAAVELQRQGRASGGVAACRTAVAEKPDDFSLKIKLAEALAAEGEYEKALEIGLAVVQHDRQGAGESARQVMVDIFQILPADSELVTQFRRKLSAALY